MKICNIFACEQEKNGGFNSDCIYAEAFMPCDLIEYVKTLPLYTVEYDPTNPKTDLYVYSHVYDDEADTPSEFLDGIWLHDIYERGSAGPTSIETNDWMRRTYEE